MATISLANDKILKQIISSIVKLVNPDKIILFGSRATGNAKKDSDYDVLILKKYGKRKALRHKLYSRGLNADAPVDMLVNTPNGFERLSKNPYYVYYDILNSGITVYEKK